MEAPFFFTVGSIRVFIGFSAQRKISVLVRLGICMKIIMLFAIDRISFFLV